MTLTMRSDAFYPAAAPTHTALAPDPSAPLRLIARRHETRSGAVHLRVAQSRYSDQAKHALQRVGSPARWLPTTGEWDYPLTPAAIIAADAAAQSLGAVIDWRDELQAYAEAHLKQAQSEHEVRLAIERIIRDGSLPLEPYTTRTLLADGKQAPPLRHQQVLFHWSQRSQGILLAWDPGVGKTRGATDAAGGWYRNGLIRPMTPTMVDGKAAVEGGVLVVCPKTMMRTWQIELQRWQSAQAVVIGGGSDRKARLAVTPEHFHIINYQSLKYVEHNSYDAVIVDEIHACANNTTQTHRVLQLARRARRRLGLTGTPITNTLESIFYPMLILDGGRSLGSSRTAFLERYFNSRVTGAGFQENTPKEDAAVRIAEAVAQNSYWVKKSEVLDLPLKTFTPVYLEMTAEQERYYHQVKNEAVTFIQDASVSVEQAAARMMKLLQICQGFALADDGTGRHFTNAKTEALSELLDGGLSGRKVVVWAYFLYEIERLTEMLKGKGIDHVRIDGSITSQRARDAAVDRFNSDDRLQVFVRQLSMSEGVTLLGTPTNPCSNMVYAGINYRLTDWLQSQDRIHRIGQRFPCSYTVFLTENGIDRRVYERVLSKEATALTVQANSKDYYLSLLKD
jgi:SNF2 family DNA or RNA helicase